MLFYESSFVFVFLPITLLVFRALPTKLRNAWLFFASCVFYATSSWFYFPLLMLTTALDYFVGARIEKSSDPRTQKRWLILSIVTNLGMLGYFKYVGFITGALRDLGLESVPLIEAPLPVGISFFVFQSMSYTIDLYRKEVHRARSFIDFGTFVTLYPQLIAGPIVRYRDIETQLREHRVSLDGFTSGLMLFSFGLAKKLLIADTFASVCDPIFAAGSPSFAGSWIAITLYAGQIYFDFSGYSDMARGLGRMIGFEFPINFDSPYSAASFSEFWRRWHITLSTFLRDYLYIPLGGNRRGPLRTQLNLLITMVLGGLWHGASWNFVIWGALHGIYLAIERAIVGPRVAAPSTLTSRVWRTVLVFLGVNIAWVFFRIDGAGAALDWLAAMFLFRGGIGTITAVQALATISMIALVLWPKNTNSFRPTWSWAETAWATACFVLSLIVGYSRDISPFLYFRF
jgi:alginate O-acetyltransferase complex protein AlgI